MSAGGKPSFDPGAARATDATVDAAARVAAAGRLVRGRAARALATDALARAPEQDGDRDTGSALPGDALSAASSARRAASSRWRWAAGGRGPAQGRRTQPEGPAGAAARDGGRARGTAEKTPGARRHAASRARARFAPGRRPHAAAPAGPWHAGRSRAAGAYATPKPVPHAGGTAAASGPVAAAVAASSVALMLVLVVISTVLAGGAADEDRRAGAHLLAQAAADEYEAGRARGDFNHKGAKYTAYVRGTGAGGPGWDACFVSWCMGEAGFVGSGMCAKYGDVGSYVARFRHHPELGEVHERDGYSPVEGDLFVTGGDGGAMHIGIVTSCDGGAFETVEGDVAGGPDGAYDRDEQDGLGGYVDTRTRRTGPYTFIHPYYSAEAVAGSRGTTDTA